MKKIARSPIWYFDKATCMYPIISRTHHRLHSPRTRHPLSFNIVGHPMSVGQIFFKSSVYSIYRMVDSWFSIRWSRGIVTGPSSTCVFIVTSEGRQYGYLLVVVVSMRWLRVDMIDFLPSAVSRYRGASHARTIVITSRVRGGGI